ncbi:hypothetical protein CBS147333_10125 [Penicillium roqueforti]|nr:hypothetical protein CBS147333_10125 [Penicillium roqueforti]KAI3188063.1 hypothetical protein CBS147311_10106 [Penicillium roqueforti]KAI3260892.1 hypothetical protein CBS147308_10086 [Penicillium roqueforti]KAI3277362.1 hypothetical protein DTO003C3_10127 [Penicillium roqueforti]
METSRPVRQTQNHIEGFACDMITSNPIVGPCVGDKMAAAESMNTTATLAWNNAAVPLTLIIPTFTLPTGSTVEAVTAAHIPAPTRLKPTIPVEGSGNVAWSSTTRWLALCYLLLLAIKMIDESL